MKGESTLLAFDEAATGLAQAAGGHASFLDVRMQAQAVKSLHTQPRKPNPKC